MTRRVVMTGDLRALRRLALRGYTMAAAAREMHVSRSSVRLYHQRYDLGFGLARVLAAWRACDALRRMVLR